MAKKDFTTPLSLNGQYPNLDDRYTNNGDPYVSKNAAETALASKLNAYHVGLTVLVADENDPDYPKAKEYWVQPKGTTPETYGLVEKGAGTTDYAALDNKPTINNVPLSGDKTASDLRLATIEQGSKADTAIQRIAVGNTATGLPGTSANVTISGATTAPVLNFLIPQGADGNDGHNPCLGRFSSAQSTFAEIPRDGDYYYVDTVTDNTTTPPTVETKIYKFDGTEWDAGTVVDVSNLTFGSGEEVTDVDIDDTSLASPAPNALAKAVDVAVIKESLSEETEVGFTGPVLLTIDTDNSIFTNQSQYQKCWYIPVSQGDVVKAEVTLTDTKSVRWGFCEEVPANGVTLSMIKSDSGTECVVVETAPVNGYFVINNTTQNVISTHKFYIVRMSLPDKVKENLSDTGYFYEEEKNILSEVSSSTSYQYRIQGSTNAWQAGLGYLTYILDISKMRAGKLKVTANSNYHSLIALLKSNTVVEGETPDYAGDTGVYGIDAGEDAVLTIPDDAKYLYVQYQNSSSRIIWPESLSVVGKYYSIGEKGSEKLMPLQGINYFEVDINPNVLQDRSSAEENIDSNTTVKSSFGVRFPDNYTPDGEPCRVLAMFHGYNGYVDGNNQTGVGTVLGYTNSNGWIDFQDVFVNAGYVVFDINGYGIYDADNNNNHHWGGPGAVLTVKKAFEYLKSHYNVCDKMLVFGFSMGGCIAWSYAMNFPNDVEVMALHEPSVPTNNDGHNDRAYLFPTIAAAYGYESWAAASADGYSNMVGFSLPLSLQRYDNGIANFDSIVNLDISSTLPTGTELVGFISCPVRIWQGTAVESDSGGDRVSVALNENIVDALRKSGCNASIRLCPGLTHSQLKQTQYVVDETLYFLNRYK